MTKECHVYKKMESQNKKREKNARGERRIEEELALLTMYTCCRRKQLDLGVMEKRGRSIGDVCVERERKGGPCW